ncbi:MAG TPA: AAA family ATPase, partial [Dehalococcoidia bacterium]|nr:AAA family ATPase [Dehalococcoidia bacterium]
AFVRGKVHGFEMDEAEVPAEQRARAELTARRCFELALSYASTRRDRPLVMAMCGEVGTGKSHIAAALAGRVGAALLRSDVVRKEVAGLAPTARLRSGFDEGLYSPQHQARTFNALFARAHRYLGDGHNVVLDATFARRDQRRRARNLAHRSGADYVVIECVAPPEVIIQRLHQRAAESVDASDATVEVYERLHGRYQPVRDDEGPAIRVDTTLPLGETLPLILAALAESPPRNASPPSPWWHS